MYRFNGRTVQPFLASAPEGYGNSTSRWQTSGQIRTLARYYTVIPCVTQFIITDIPKHISGSLDPTCVPVRYIYLTVRLIICSYTQIFISNEDELTFESLRYFLEGYRPNKTVSDTHFDKLSKFLIIRLVFHFLSFQRSSDLEHNYQLNYTNSKNLQYIITVKLQGSSCLIVFTQHLHYDFNFTGSIYETVERSLPLSYFSTIN